METCPKCERWSVLPHCAHAACIGSWCTRAECGWESEESCPHTRPAWLLEEMEAGPKRRFKPVLVPGFWVRTIIGSRPVGFFIDHNDPAPDWLPEDLYAMSETTAEAIAALTSKTTEED